MFRVITIEREYGSGGRAIARAVAGILGWKLLDRTFIDAVVRAAQVDPETARRYDEQVDSWWRRINAGSCRLAPKVTHPTRTHAPSFNADKMAAFAHALIECAAAKGHYVIVGRGAQCVLHDSSDALRVFVYGPSAERLWRTQRRLGTTENVPKVLRSKDEMHATYIRRHFGRDWKDPQLYDLIVNSHLGISNAARLITATVASESLAISGREDVPSYAHVG